MIQKMRTTSGTLLARAGEDSAFQTHFWMGFRLTFRRGKAAVQSGFLPSLARLRVGAFTFITALPSPHRSSNTAM
jgi:hypothetical protein